MRIIWIMIVVFSTVNGAPSESNTPDDSKLEDIYGDLVDGNSNMQNDHTNADVQNDFDNKDEDYEDEIDRPEESMINEKAGEKPILKSINSEILADPNSTVVLPCAIENLGNYVFVWNKEHNVVYQLNIKVTKRKNINTDQNNSLIISNFSPSDAGNYSCSILITETDRPTVYHSVQAKQPPQIYNLTLKTETKIIQPGDSIELNCLASGVPKPKITWHFRHAASSYSEKLGTEGETIRIERITHRESGKYKCLADNKVGVASQEIDIYVHHKPIISIERIINNSEKGKDIELKCTVHATPRAAVNWQKDGTNIARSNDLSIETHEHDHILFIKNLDDNDFGTYTCRATNGMGTASKNVTIVKTPAILDFIKPDKAHKEVVLKWRVESKSPISDHEIQYRREGEEKWRTGSPMVKSSDNNDIYVVEYKIDGLDSGKYETRVRSQNSYGWSDYSDTVFEGVYPKKGQHHKQHKKSHKDSKEKHTSAPQQDIPAQNTENEIDNEKGVGASVSGGSTISAAFSLVSISLILLWHRQ